MNTEKEIYDLYIDKFKEIRKELKEIKDINKYHEIVDIELHKWILKRIKFKKEFDKFFYENYIKYSKKIDFKKLGIRDEYNYVDKLIGTMEEYQLYNYEYELIRFIESYLTDKYNIIRR